MVLRHRDRELLRFEWVDPQGVRVVSVNEALADPRFSDIFFFDAVIFNTDRHMGNFGYLVDNDTNEIVGAAPIFDNGYGLFSLALDRKGDSHDEFCDLRRFVSRVNPALYMKWLGFPGGLTKHMKERLDGLRGFRIKRHPRYNLPVRRIEAIEDFTQKRIREICEYGVKAYDFLAIQADECTVNRAQDSVRCTHNSDSLSEQIKQNMRADPFITKMELADLLQIPASSLRAASAAEAFAVALNPECCESRSDAIDFRGCVGV